MAVRRPLRGIGHSIPLGRRHRELTEPRWPLLCRLQLEFSFEKSVLVGSSAHAEHHPRYVRARWQTQRRSARTKVTLASLEFNKFIASMRFEREGRVLLDKFTGPSAHIATLPQSDDEWAVAALPLETFALLLAKPCTLADGSAYALASLGQEGRRLVSVDLESARCSEVSQPDDLQAGRGPTAR